MLRTLPSTSPREAAERLSRGEVQLVDVREASEIAAAATRAALAARLDATNASCGGTAWARQGHPRRRSVRTTDAPSPREPEHGR